MKYLPILTGSKQLQINSLSNKRLPEAVQFVEKYEYSCTTLMEHLLASESDSFVLEKEGCVFGFFYIRQKRTIFHCIPNIKKINPIDYFSLKKALSNFLSQYNIFCVSGEKSGTELIENAIKMNGRSPTAECNYFLMLMKNNPPNKATEKPTQPNPQKNITCIQCNTANESDLLNLQIGYQIEEVLPPGQNPNTSVIRLSLAEQLKSQWIFACKLNAESQEGIFVAKAGTNAIGKNYAQIGGVFTDKNYRSRGLCFLTFNTLISYIISKNKKPVLFAREKNLPAITVYKKSGFSKIGNYEIVYY